MLQINIAGVSSEDLSYDDKPSPKMKYNSKTKSELRSAADIRKLHSERDDNKMKTMKKGKRKTIEAKNRKTRKTAAVEKSLSRNVGNRRSKVIVRF